MKQQDFFGQAAMDHKYAAFAADTIGGIGPMDLKEFKKFQWMLSADQRQKVDLWHKDAMVQAKARLQDERQASLDDEKSSEGISKLSSKGPSSSPCSAACESSASSKGPAKKQKVAAEKTKVTGAGGSLMKFFGAKAM
jgi:hypothetical protein